MTHTLHRLGSREDLTSDFVVLAIPARGFNRKGAAPKLAEILKIFSSHNPVNYGDALHGNRFSSTLDEMVNGAIDEGAVHAVFTNEDDLTACLKDLKEADLGISVVVSGLFDYVEKCCQEAGLKRHTVNTSVGVFGNTERLADEGIREISTMCGHSMISFNLVKYCVAEIKAGRTTARAAAEKMAANCHCGIANPERMTRILERLANA